MDLIDELLERDAGTVNSTIIGKPLNVLGSMDLDPVLMKKLCAPQLNLSR